MLLVGFRLSPAAPTNISAETKKAQQLMSGKPRLPEYHIQDRSSHGHPSADLLARTGSEKVGSIPLSTSYSDSNPVVSSVTATPGNNIREEMKKNPPSLPSRPRVKETLPTPALREQRNQGIHRGQDGKEHQGTSIRLTLPPPRCVTSSHTRDTSHHAFLSAKISPTPLVSAVPPPLHYSEKKEKPSVNPFPSGGSIVTDGSTTLLEAVVGQRTITEQQRTIHNLQELVQTTKARVEYLEEQNKSLRDKQYEASPMLAEELEMLRKNNTQLVRQTALLMDEKSWLEKRLESSHIAFKDLQDHLQEQLKMSAEKATREEDYQYHVSLLHIAETDRKQLKIENLEMRRALDRCAFEKKRWRALVQTLAAHLPLSLNDHIEKHVRSMVQEEEKRFQEALAERRARQEPLLFDCSSSERRIENGPLSGVQDTKAQGGLTNREPAMRPVAACPSESFSTEIRMVWRRPITLTEENRKQRAGESSSSTTADKCTRNHPSHVTPLSRDGGAGAAASALPTALGAHPDTLPLVLPPTAEPRGAFNAVPFHQSSAIPARVPGSVGLGVFQEDSLSKRLNRSGKRKLNETF